MEPIHLLDRLLRAEGTFDEAVTLTLTQILPTGDRSRQLAAWEKLTQPGYSFTVNNVTAKGCPFLLGCLQIMERDDIQVLGEWQKHLRAAPVARFLTARGEPLSHWHYAQAVLACVESAMAARRTDEAALLRHGAYAAQWFHGTAPEEPSEGPQVPSGAVSFLTPVQDCFASLAAHLQIPTARARHLTQWLLSSGRYREPLRTRKIMVPFYLDGKHSAGVATLEMELVAGRGEFYADPVAMAFVRWDRALQEPHGITRAHLSFQESYDNACAYVRKLGWWPEDTDICWRLQADPPLFSLTGGSAGGAFFAALWHLRSDTFSDLSVTISAGITPDGVILPVDHILEKIHAVLKIPELSDVVVSEDQPEVQARPYDRLRIWKVRQAANLEQHGR